MKKSSDILHNLNKIIEKMSNGEVDSIIDGACSDVPIANLNAVIFGAKYNITDEKFINALESNLLKSNEKFFGMELKAFVLAALDVLRIKKYTGNDETVKRLIDSKFNF